MVAEEGNEWQQCACSGGNGDLAVRGDGPSSTGGGGTDSGRG